MLEYNDFKKQVALGIRDSRPVKDGEMEIRQGCEYGQDYVTAYAADMYLNDTPVLLFKNLYECYLEEMGEPKEYAKRAVSYFRRFFDDIRRFLASGREVLDQRVFFRIAGEDERLFNCPTVSVLNMRIVYGFLYNSMTDILVTSSLARKCRYTDEDLKNAAFRNTPVLFPVKELDPRGVWQADVRTVILSNTLGRYGASVILYPGLLQKISETFPQSDGLYVFPFGTDYAAVTDSIGDAAVSNSEYVGERPNDRVPEKFSDSIYYFDTAASRLTLTRNSDRSKIVEFPAETADNRKERGNVPHDAGYDGGQAKKGTVRRSKEDTAHAGERSKRRGA